MRRHVKAGNMPTVGRPYDKDEKPLKMGGVKLPCAKAAWSAGKQRYKSERIYGIYYAANVFLPHAYVNKYRRNMMGDILIEGLTDIRDVEIDTSKGT